MADVGGGRQITGGTAIQPDLVVTTDRSPVRVVVTNYTHALHSFDSPQLHVNIAILPGTPTHPHRTVFTFLSHSSGAIRWYCAVPCGDGYMGGTVYAIIET